MRDGSLPLRVPNRPEVLQLSPRGTAGTIAGALTAGDGRYEWPLLTAMERVLSPDSSALDVGANVGTVALVLGALCRRGTVYAFEPAAESFAQLQRNLDRNGMDHVVPLPLAISDANGSSTMNFTPDNPGGSFMSTTPVPEGRPEPVETVRLDDWMAGVGLPRLRLIKMDVEGAEMRALRGAVATIARLRPDLFVELNPITLRRFGGTDHVALFELLRSLYPSVRYVRDDGDTIAVRGRRHLRLLLERWGLITVHCTFAVPPPATRSGVLDVLRSARDLARLERALNRWRCPADSFLVVPRYRLSLPARPLAGRPGELRSMPVELRNTSRSWLSSGFTSHPVHMSYRVVAAGDRLVADGIRTFLPEPIRPGRSLSFECFVRLPPGTGSYEVVFSLVQEGYAWFCDVDPVLGQRVPAEVRR